MKNSSHQPPTETKGRGPHSILIWPLEEVVRSHLSESAFSAVAAFRVLERYLSDHPEDARALYLLAFTTARTGFFDDPGMVRTAKDLQTALDLGLPQPQATLAKNLLLALPRSPADLLRNSGRLSKGVSDMVADVTLLGSMLQGSGRLVSELGDGRSSDAAAEVDEPMESDLAQRYLTLDSFYRDNDAADAAELARSLVELASVDPQLGESFVQWWAQRFSTGTDFSDASREREIGIERTFLERSANAQIEDLPLLLIARQLAAFHVADTIDQRLAASLQSDREDVLGMLLVALGRIGGPFDAQESLCELIADTNERRADTALSKYCR